MPRTILLIQEPTQSSEQHTEQLLTQNRDSSRGGRGDCMDNFIFADCKFIRQGRCADIIRNSQCILLRDSLTQQINLIKRKYTKFGRIGKFVSGFEFIKCCVIAAVKHSKNLQAV